MAEAGARVGQALRVHQLLLVLAVGWLAGRLPQLLDDNAREQVQFARALGSTPAPEAIMPDQADTARLAAEVASRVAAEVADATIARLLAAGWRPVDSVRPVVIREAGMAPQQSETVLRIVTEAPPIARLDYSLPPAPPRPVDALPKPLAVQPAKATDRAGQAHALASQGYAALRSGDRRTGVEQLEAAALMAPDAPEAAAWAADARQQRKRWTISAYTLARGGGSGDPLAASPVLGGGQSGAQVAYALNPLALRRVSVFGRITAAARPDGAIDSETTEAALGLRVRLLAGVPVDLDVERRFALGAFARNAWAVRASGGAARNVKVARRPVLLEGYGEAGLVGFDSAPDLYAGGQMRGATPLFSLGRVTVDAGAGAWGGVQRSFGSTASRFDLGPSARFAINPWAFTAQVDYRARVAGNALPASGPVLTVAGAF